MLFLMNLFLILIKINCNFFLFPLRTMLTKIEIMLHINVVIKNVQNHAYELAIKEGTHNILKTKYLPSLIPLGGGSPQKYQPS